jgi:tight adherence protein B
LREQFPDAVDMLARSIRAGETLDQAIETVGVAARDPMGTEFRRCARHLDMGLSVDAAMQALTRRAPIFETRILAATLMVQRRTGGNLPLTLERLAKVVRDRLSYYRQFRAATASARLSALIIALAGPLLLAFMFYFQPDYIDDLFTTRLGQMLLAVAIVLQVIGVIWIFRLLRTSY